MGPSITGKVMSKSNGLFVLLIDINCSSLLDLFQNRIMSIGSQLASLLLDFPFGRYDTNRPNSNSSIQDRIITVVLTDTMT